MVERKTFAAWAAASLFLAGSIAGIAQDAENTDAEEQEIEEIVVTGSHIKGANITGALPVSVISSEEIEAMGVESGDDLMQFIPEQGQNYFNEEENISGGVNSARGDVGAFNLRSLGTGNTLVLLNGRRMVNEASFQTEEVGGSFVPVNTVNSNTLPVYGLDRVEILKDGASALYGADAVAGVVNTVLKTDFERLRARVRYGWFDHVGRKTKRLSLEWGSFVNGGKTHMGIMADYYDRNRVSAQEDDRWADADFRRRLPPDSPWAGETDFRNTSAHSLYGQFDVRTSVRRLDIRNTLTDTAGEFEVYPSGHERCQWDLGYGSCAAIDGQGIIRYNLNQFRDISQELKRGTVFFFLNHEFDNGFESFSELMYYGADTLAHRHPSYSFSTVKLRVGAENYYNPFGPCGSPNRLPESVIGNVPCDGLELEIDFYRYAELPRIVENDGSVVRLLQGLRGTAGRWDWEGALLWSRAEKKDLTRNRVSNTLMVEALSDPTPAAYNPFSGGVDSNIERALVDVYRNNEMTLMLGDFQVSSAELFDLPWGPVGGVAGLEIRRETFEDDRDPRLDGTIVFTDFQGDTYPLVSDVVNSSPTPDNSGDRNVTSLFTEFQLPLMNNVDVQLAARYENFSDVGSAVVGKLAGGWQIAPTVLLRGSWSEAFRAPNLITINEEIVARQNTRTDYACEYAANNGGDPEQDILDCVNSTQRIAQGSSALKPERSDNYSFGIVVQPTDVLTLTLDFWSIEKEDTIGLLGEENHTVQDLVARLQHGPGNCGSLNANPAVVREEADPESDEVAIYQAAGICPAGAIRYISDNYANLNTRKLKGWDVGLYYAWETGIGDFNLRYLASFLSKFEQVPGGQAAELVAAKESGLLPASIPVAGFGDLLQVDGNQKSRQTLFLSWRRNPLAASVSGRHIGTFYQDSLTLDDGTLYWIPTVTTWNATVDYRWKMSDRSWRLRFGVNNLFDKRAPLADRYYGYFSDAGHRDFGRNFYLELRMTDED